MGGFALGLWFTFAFSIESPRYPPAREIGFPLAWDFPGKGGVARSRNWDFAVVDMMLLTSVSIYPVWLANTLWRFLRKRTQGTPNVA